MSSKKLSPSQLRKFRSEVATLKAKGLVSKSKDARKQQPTRYMLGQVKKYSDVISGKAAVVKTPSRKRAAEYSGIYETKGKYVVLPNSGAKNERPHYNKRTGEITSTYKRGETTVHRVYPRTALVNGTQELPQGPGIIYTIPFGSRGSYRTNSLQDLYAQMRDLIASGWKNVAQYVIVERISNGHVKRSAAFESDFDPDESE